MAVEAFIGDETGRHLAHTHDHLAFYGQATVAQHRSMRVKGDDVYILNQHSHHAASPLPILHRAAARGLVGRHRVYNARTT